MRYVALFRGLNVGGKNAVKMADLRSFLSDLGLAGVKTFIQSGNALFESREGEAVLAERIQAGFRSAFGFDSPVILRTAEEMAAIVGSVPFSRQEREEACQAAAGAESLYCFLLEDEAPAARIQAIQADPVHRDRLVAQGREIYLLCYQSIRESKLAAQFAKLGIPMTSRNLKTLGKLSELARQE